MRSLYNRHSEFFGHVAILMSGKAMAALLALVTTPIISRLFSPEHFGIAAVFMSIVNILSNGASLKYEAAVALPKDEAEAFSIMALAYRVLVGACLLFFLLIGIYELTNPQWLTVQSMGAWVWALPFGVFLTAVVSIQESWLTRTKAFRRSSAALVVKNAVTSGTRIGFGALAGSSVSGLLFGNIIGLVSQQITLRTTGAESTKAILRPQTLAAMREIARRYDDFPKYNALAALIFALGQNLPVLLFGAMFTPVVAGFYAMANRLFQVPVSIVAVSVRRVFTQRVAAIHNRGGGLRRAFLLATGGLGLLGSLPFAVLWLYGEPLLGWLLGERWLAAGRYLEIMAPWLFTVWLASACNPVFIVLREQKFFLFRQSVLTLLRFGAFGIAYALSAEPEWTLQAFVYVTVFANVFTIVSAYLLIAKHAPADRLRDN